MTTALSAVVTHRQYRAAIESTVKAINQAQQRAVLLLELVVRQAVQTHLTSTINWQTLINKVFVEQAATLTKAPPTPRATSSELWTWFESVRQQWRQFIKGTDLENRVVGNAAGAAAIQEASKAYHTTLWKNYDKEALPMHFSSTMSQVFALSKRDANALESQLPSPTATRLIQQHPSIKRWVTQYHELKPNLGNAKMRLQVANFRLQLLRLLEDNDTTDKPTRKFTLLPHYSTGRGFITLSQQCFATILKCPQALARTRALAEAPLSDEERACMRQICATIKQTRKEATRTKRQREGENDGTKAPRVFYNREQYLPPRPSTSSEVNRMERKGWHFPATIKTDGVTICIPWERLVGSDTPEDLHTVLWTKTPALPAIDDTVRTSAEQFAASTQGVFALSAVGSCEDPFIAVDPGIVNVFTGIDQRGRVVKHSRKAWYGSFKAPRRRTLKPGERWNSHRHRATKGWVHPNVVKAEALRSQHSIKASDLEAWKCAVKKHWIPSHLTLFRWYSSRALANARLARHGRRQRHLFRMMQELAPKAQHVIALGNGFHGQRMRRGMQGGCAPIKGMRRFLSKFRRVVLIDEYMTSQRCPDCKLTGKNSADILQHPRLLRRDRYVKVNGVSQCTHCHTTHSRDVAAARNIAAVYKAQVEGGSRPAYLCRPGHRSRAASSSVKATQGRDGQHNGSPIPSKESW